LHDTPLPPDLQAPVAKKQLVGISDRFKPARNWLCPTRQLWFKNSASILHTPIKSGFLVSPTFNNLLYAHCLGIG
jgi:hypothetical protein